MTVQKSLRNERPVPEQGFFLTQKTLPPGGGGWVGGFSVIVLGDVSPIGPGPPINIGMGESILSFTVRWGSALYVF